MNLTDIATDLQKEATAPFVGVIQGHIERAREARTHISKGTYVVKASADDEESGLGDFLDFEELMAGVFANAWARKAGKAVTEMIDALDGTYTGDVITKGTSYTPSGMDMATSIGSKLMGDIITPADEKRLLTILKQAAQRGAAMVNGTAALEQAPRYATVMDNMVKASKYWSNNYFNTQVVPSLYRAVENVMEDGDLTQAERIYRSVRQAIDDRLLKRTPYWQTVSSGAASRSYHYGLVKAGRSMGYRGYELAAVRDERTSQICVHLDGKQFWLADAEVAYERIANSDGEDIKDVHPWLTEEEAIGISASEVHQRATVVPPFHGRCRTTMRLLRM